MSKVNLNSKVFMERALGLASKGRGSVSPNPMVGAVLVKNNKIIAEGFHKEFRKAHAEVNALRNVKAADLKGVTLYVTLEPCHHFGKTPPCVDLLISMGVEHVVIAMKDPNPLTSGKSISKLRKAGVKVEVGILKKEAELLNESFIYSILHKSPFFILKAAMTLDGKIATSSGDSRWITNEFSRKYVHKMRSYVDAILTTSKTVLCDNPHLGVRSVIGRDPLRIVLDRYLKTPITSLVYRDKNVLVVTTSKSTESKREIFNKAGISLLIYPEENISLKKLLHDLWKRNIGTVMTEAGAGLITSALKEKVVNKVCFFIAPKILGDGLSVVGELNISNMKNILKLANVTTQKFGDDIMVMGYLK